MEPRIEPGPKSWGTIALASHRLIGVIFSLSRKTSQRNKTFVGEASRGHSSQGSFVVSCHLKMIPSLFFIVNFFKPAEKLQEIIQ